MMELGNVEAYPGEMSEPNLHSEVSMESTGVVSQCDPTMPVTAHLLQEVNFSEARKSPVETLYPREDSLEGFLHLSDDLSSPDSMAAPIKMDLFPDFEVTYIMPSELSTFGLDMYCDDRSNDGTNEDSLEAAPPLIEAQAQLSVLDFPGTQQAFQSTDLSVPIFDDVISLPTDGTNIPQLIESYSKYVNAAQHDQTDDNLPSSPAKLKNSVDKPELNSPVVSSEPIKKIICDVCNKVFAHHTSLIYHRRSHTGHKPYQCDICSKRFTRPGFLAIHKKTHSGPGYSCKICSKSFVQLYSLRLHEKSHTGDRPYKCDQCQQSFARPNVLQKHKKTHIGVKSFVCDICMKPFGRSDHLQIHKRTHTKATLFSCGVCGKCFVTSDGLHRHEYTHSGQKTHVCETCGKSFSRASYLNEHRKRHNAQKNFQCKECNKMFTSSSLLVQHQITHSSERPFPCHQCEKAFRRKTHLKQHLKVHYKP